MAIDVGDGIYKRSDVGVDGMWWGGGGRKGEERKVMENLTVVPRSGSWGIDPNKKAGAMEIAGVTVNPGSAGAVATGKARPSSVR
jgi:hypothetical protein